MEMLEPRITKEESPVVYDLDDYRRGRREQPGQARITMTPDHKLDLWTIQAGQALPLHVHSDSECLMIVLAGQGEYRQEGRSWALKKDMLAVAPPGAAHGIVNASSDPLIVLTIEGPGPFDVRLPGRGALDQHY